jgi:maltose alpha-D-glucosyltransferase/alpha-amylase
MDQSPYWYQQAVFYEVSLRGFFDGSGNGHGDLVGLIQKLDYLQALGINCIWLLPIYPSPLRDDGYDIADFLSIDPAYGTLEDFKALIQAAHKLQIRVVMDLVMNHTSDQHPWFLAARMDRKSPYHDYYVWSDTDKRYPDARIIFTDTEPSNWTWNEATQEYYWHRFYACQPDLNYDNPAVKAEMFKVVQFWLDRGIDGFRLDAVPYLIERDGTNGENLPETHQVLKDLRAFVDANYTDKVLICEANQWPVEVREYLGDGDECHMAFNFPIMPRIFMSLKQGNAAPIHWALDQLPSIPSTCQWGTFLRNHDELTLEMVTPEEREFMWREYSPDPVYRLNLGIRRRLAALLDNDRRKIELVYSLLFSLPGSPFIYYGDEIGMGDDVTLFDRNGLRTPMQWDAGRNGGFTTAEKCFAPVISDPVYGTRHVNVRQQMADEGSLWHKIQQMITLKKLFSVLFSHGIDWLPCSHISVVAYQRGKGHDAIICVHHLVETTEEVRISVPDGNFDLKDIFTGQKFRMEDGNLSVVLPPYGYLWLKHA